MFRKILVAEDSDGMNTAMSEAFNDFTTSEVVHSRYCEEAFLKVRKGIQDNDPFDLLVTDLSFISDGKDTKLTCGESLIAAVLEIQPDIKIIVFSIEERAYKIRTLFRMFGISGYVAKGRHGISELKKAVKAVSEGENHFLSAGLLPIRSHSSDSEIDAYDISLLKLLAKGMKQDQIAEHFRSNNISPASISAVEKRIAKLKTNLRANNSIQVVVKAIDLGLIDPVF